MNIREFAALKKDELIYSDQRNELGIVVWALGEAKMDCVAIRDPWGDTGTTDIFIEKGVCGMFEKFTDIRKVQNQKLVNIILFNVLMDVKAKLVFLGTNLSDL